MYLKHIKPIMPDDINITVQELLHHYTNDYLLNDDLIELQHNIINVDDCKDCLACKVSDTLSDDMSSHLNSHMDSYQRFYKKLNFMFHQDYTLDEPVLDLLVKRKQNILAVLMFNTIKFKDRAILENKIVQIDNRIGKSHGGNQQYIRTILQIMDHLKYEMFKLDDLLEYKLRMG